MAARTDPIGVILAGGEGRRIGGSKATVELHGQPLIVYPWRALRAVLEEVVILAKASTALPALAGITVWIEPEEPRHPLHGIVHALALAGGRRVLICAVDLPFVTPDLIRALVSADLCGAPAVVASLGPQLQPLLGRTISVKANALFCSETAWHIGDVAVPDWTILPKR